MPNFWKKLKTKCAKQRRPILALAPMAGITDSAFRLICKKFCADVVYSEMVSADALHHGSKVTLKMLYSQKKEHPLIIQLFGKDPIKFAKAALVAEQAGADGIDINFGCPAHRVVAHGGGATLMRDFEVSRRIIETVIANTRLPVSIKVRISINSADKKNKITFLRFYKYISDLNIAAIMIHGRSYEQGFAGYPDFAEIKKAVHLIKSENSNMVVLANGGINTPNDAKEMIKKTGADGIGLARGILGKPWLFKQIKDFYSKGVYKEFSINQIKKTALAHAKLINETKPQKGMFEIRKHLAWYVKGVKNASQYRQSLVTVKSLGEIEAIFAGMVKN